MKALQWDDASTATYTADSTMIGDLVVVVCLDDEGPIGPAFFWTVETTTGQRIDEGWGHSVPNARKQAVSSARGLNRSGWETA